MNVRGEFGLRFIDGSGRVKRLPNTVMYGWGYAAARLFGFGDGKYKIGALYAEFENVASPSDTVSPPPFDRNEGVDYYLNLSGNRDFLRLPLVSLPKLEIASGFENFFDEGEGNKITFIATTDGQTAGNRGLAFSDTANSKIFGLAAVATPDWSDPTQDVVVARAYYAASDQVLKEANVEIAVSWSHTFE